MVFQVILNVTRRLVVLVEFFVSSVSPCFRLRPMRCAIRRGKGLYGSYDNNNLLACSPYMVSEASREGTREKTHSSDLSRAALACFLAIPSNGCSQAMIMRIISLFSARLSIRKLWQLLPPLIMNLVLIITVVMMVNLSSKFCFVCARVTTNTFKFDFVFKCLTVMLRRALKLQASLQDCMYTNVFLTYSMHC